MSWGYKILIVYIVFVFGILVMVFKSSNQKTDLVTTDYYEKELKYQDKINAMNSIYQLSDTVKYEVADGKLRIVFPKDFSGKRITGNAILYCPSDENKDITQKFSIEDTPVFMSVPRGNASEYNLQLSWEVNGTSYYFEKKLLIN